jgi:hypothetical protein
MLLMVDQRLLATRNTIEAIEALFGKASKADSLMNPKGALLNCFSDRIDSLLIL